MAIKRDIDQKSIVNPSTVYLFLMLGRLFADFFVQMFLMFSNRYA